MAYCEYLQVFVVRDPGSEENVSWEKSETEKTKEVLDSSYFWQAESETDYFHAQNHRRSSESEPNFLIGEENFPLKK